MPCLRQDPKFRDSKIPGRFGGGSAEIPKSGFPGFRASRRRLCEKSAKSRDRSEFPESKILERTASPLSSLGVNRAQNEVTFQFPTVPDGPCCQPSARQNPESEFPGPRAPLPLPPRRNPESRIRASPLGARPLHGDPEIQRSRNPGPLSTTEEWESERQNPESRIPPPSCSARGRQLPPLQHPDSEIHAPLRCAVQAGSQ